LPEFFVSATSDSVQIGTHIVHLQQERGRINHFGRPYYSYFPRLVGLEPWHCSWWL